MLRTPEAMHAALDRDEDLDSYVTTRDPKDETYYTRGLAEDAYVSVNTLFDPVVVGGKVVGVSAHDDNAVKDDGSSTITLEQYLGNVVSVALGAVEDTPVHTVSVEGTFMQVVDLAATYAAGDRAINVYTDKDGYQRIGSVRLRYLASGTPVAECVKCKASLIYKGAAEGTSSRKDQEAFILGVITHGHNHSAKWVTKTPIGEPIALSICDNAALVEKYNDALFDQYVLDAYDTVVPADNLARFRRVNGF